VYVQAKASLPGRVEVDVPVDDENVQRVSLSENGEQRCEFTLDEVTRQILIDVVARVTVDNPFVHNGGEPLVGRHHERGPGASAVDVLDIDHPEPAPRSHRHERIEPGSVAAQ
jgi:hypothetical protein